MFGWMILAVMFIAAVFGLIRSAYERNCLTVSEYTVCSEKLSPEFDGKTLIFLADLHNKSFGEKNVRLLETIRGMNPDMVLIGGDTMVAKGQMNCPLEVTAELISALAKKYPVYYGYGNHELRLKTLPVYEEIHRTFLQTLRAAGVRILDDCSVSFRGEKGSLTISGLTLTKETYHRFKKQPLESGYIEKRIGRVPEDDMRILLAHNPLYFEEYARWGADLTLSGHYHGGTIILPILGGVMSPDYHLFPRRYRGRYETEGKTMVLSGGLGTHSINIRFGNKPELAVIRLQCKSR
ncbi:MAG: metallophosphoesterase [Lachnospiraceae bacterium]|nr:metallophosphoesterase [Lachnospiraceae bacterium]